MTATDAIDAREYMSDLPPAPPEIERRRGMMILNWIVRDYIPRWLALVPESRERTYALRRLPEIVDGYDLETHGATLGAYDWADSAACEALWAAARDLARVTGRDLSYAAPRVAAQAVADAVAQDTAVDAAVYAVGEAVPEPVWATPQRVVGETARAAVEAAVLAVARDVAQAAPQGTREGEVWAAVRQALAPTVAACQRSAHALLDRLIALDHHPQA